jgi:signal transduction histidine kinase
VAKSASVTTNSFALARVEKLVGRVFGIALLLSSLELVANALAFESPSSLNFQIDALVLVLAAYIGGFISYWFFDGSKFWFGAQAILAVLTCVLWSALLDPIADGPEKPWIWWAIGNAGIAAALAFRPIVAGLFMTALPILWFFVRTSAQGGGAAWGDALQDSIYTLLFSLSIVGLISLFKDSARTVDLENHRAALAAAERAATDAVESERARIDALVHDKVLTALLVAASSDSKETQDAAAELSKTAIASLENLESETASDTRVITVNSLFRALKDAVARLDNQIEIHIDNSSDQTIDPHVADALTEATIQAVNNSLLHAGAQAKRGLKMRTNKDKLKIVIYDTGRGFRVGRIPKNRLGLRLSIIDRVEKVGGRVFIDSRPGDGTNIILEWGPK